MNYRTLGRTGLQVSEIGFGCGNIGGLLDRGTHEDQVIAVNRAQQLGINYFDTAPVYGDGKSELNLGRVLAGLKPNVILATKVRLVADDLKDVRSAIKRSLETSLSRLRRDYVDVLQLHNQISVKRDQPNWPDSLGLMDVLGRNGIADVFENLRSEGLIRFFGFTGLGETSALQQVIDSGHFDVVQAYYNLLNPSAGVAMPPGFGGHNFGQLIDRAMGQNMGVVVIRVMAGGALGGEKARTGYASPTVDGPIVPAGDYQPDQARARKLDFLLARDVGSLPQASVRFALMHPSVSTVLVGFSNLNQVEEAAGCSGKAPLPKTAIEHLMELWDTDFGRQQLSTR